MKRQLLAVLGFLLGMSSFAHCGEPPIPPVTRYLVPERIRNTPAVDPDVIGNGIRFYVSTFGLERFNGSQTHMVRAPLPKPGCLVRFGINNKTPPFEWSFTSVIIDSMNALPFNQPETISINCYNVDDEQGLEIAYPDLLVFTDESQHTEGWMRYHSGTGFWASPVFFKDNLGRKHVVLLNKSGCLMSVDITNQTPVVDWKTDLRSPERYLDPNSYKFEFIATPVLLDSKIYVVGIKQIHIVNVTTGDLIQPSYTCPNMDSSDYFESSLVHDTSAVPNRCFYLISRLGKAYRFCEQLVSELTTTPLGVSQSPPLLDSDGHVYYVTKGPSGPLLNFIEQEQRTLITPTAPMTSISLPTFISTGNVKSSILTDFTQNKYMFQDCEIIRIKEMYDFTQYSAMIDPVAYPANNATEWCTYTYLNTSGIRFPGNHSVLSYHNSTNKTMLFTLSNVNSHMYGDGVADYYPSNLDEYDISSTSISLSYVAYNNAYTIPSVQVSESTIESNRQTWGGIALYQSSIPSITGYLNALFGDECGAITTYNCWLSSTSVGFDPMFEFGETVIPEMGYAKYMKNLDNMPSNNEVNQFKVFLYGLEYVEGSYTFANAYARENLLDVIPGTQVNVISATFNNLLPNKRYRITWKDDDDEVVFCDNIEIDNNSDFVIINADPDMVVEDTLNDPDNETTWLYPHQPLHFNSVTLEDNAHWRIDDNSNITVTRLILGSRSQVTIGEGAMLNVGETICNSPNGVAVFNVDGQHTGKLNVTSNLENTENSSLQFKGYNLQSPSYVLNTVVNKPNAILELKSMNSIATSDYVSTSMGSLQNRGRVDINDCTEVTRNYIDTWQDSGQTIRGTLKIKNGSDFGNLVWKIADGSIKSPFFIGETTLTQPQRAKLTIEDATCTFKGYGNNPPTYSVYGNIVVKGNAKCVVNDSATLRFKTGSKLDLLGNLDVSYNGAEVIANMTPLGSLGIISFEEGVSISGMKPNPAPNDPNRFGDRILTDENGRIEGVDLLYPRKLTNLLISTSNQNNSRWDGIYINTTYTDGSNFMLDSSNLNIISGIDKIYVKDPGNAPLISGIKFVNCTYGVYSTTGTDFQPARVTTITGCVFKDCSYGIYLEDTAPNNTQPSLSAIISNCEFGNNDALSGFNFAGIALRRAVNVSVNDCDFFRNGYGIISLQSSVLVGGSYADTYPYLPTQGQPCRFYNNEKAGINFEQSSNNQSRSLIFRNEFSGDYSTPTAPSGIGIWANESIVDVIENDFNNLGWHGMLIKNYNWNSNTDYHGFAINSFQNNKGSELIGDAVSLSTSRIGLNYFNDILYHETGFVPTDPLDNFESWDKYILANLSGGMVTSVANMRGNSFAQTPFNNRERFYPSYGAFRFDPDVPTTLTETIAAGMNQFHQGLFDESIQSMKQAVEVYPDSLLTKLAIDYLYLATRASSEDYSDLRAYLDLKIPTDNFATYVKKEEIKTKCYIKEEDYLTAISRLQLILDNPETVADSLFALVDQAYCYMNLASEGDKSLPDISVKTPDFVSYMEFLAGLSSTITTGPQINLPTPQILNIESNYPNPFNPETTIRFAVPNDGRVIVTIYNIKGQKVKQLLNEQVIAGKHTIMWNGTDSRGMTVSSGLYFVRVEQGNQHRCHKMVLMK